MNFTTTQNTTPHPNPIKSRILAGERATRAQALAAFQSVRFFEDEDDLTRHSAPLIRETTQEISEVLETLGYLLPALKLPRKLADFCVTAMRAAQGQTGKTEMLELSDLALGKRHFPEIAAEIDGLKAQRAEIVTKAGKVRPLVAREIDERLKLKETALARRIARLRTQLREWQVENRIELIFSVDGTRKYLKGGGFEDVRSRYRLNVLAMAAEVLESARTDRDYQRKPGLAFRRAADTVAHAIKRQKVTLPEKREIKPEAILKQAKAWSKKYTDLWPASSDARRAAAAAYLEWAVEHAKKCGVEISEIEPDFSLNHLKNQQLDLVTLFASPGESETETEKIDTVLCAPEEQCQFSENPSAVESVSKCANPLPPAHQFGQPRDEFIYQAELSRQKDWKREREERLASYFSLAELERFDPRAGGRSKTERDFKCPACDPEQKHSRSLGVNTRTGEYFCHRCEAKGCLREHCEAGFQELTLRIPSPQDEAKRQAQSEQDAREQATKAAAARKLHESAAALSAVPVARDYVETRTGAADVAEQSGVKYAQHKGRKVIEAPFQNQFGEVVAFNDRAIDGSKRKTLTKGPKSLGVFATSGALEATTVAITEAPLDALALAGVGLDAIALGGTTWPKWLERRLEGKRVLLAFDADTAGDEAAQRLRAALLGSALIERLRPSSKDWCEIFETRGQEALREEVARVLLGDADADEPEALEC